MMAAWPLSVAQAAFQGIVWFVEKALEADLFTRLAPSGKRQHPQENYRNANTESHALVECPIITQTLYT
jgi:hypothetical protein